MTAAETARPQRRVGTFTLGVTLVLGGTCMLASLLWPRLDLSWALRCSPLILVSLGAETLLSTRGGGRVRYDWLGMLLCFVLIGAALAMYGTVWWCLNGDGPWGGTSRWAGEDVYEMTYARFGGWDEHAMDLAAGDALELRVRGGGLAVEIEDPQGRTLYAADPAGDGTIPIPADGRYTIQVAGSQAPGGFSFRRIPAEEHTAIVPD